MAKDRTPRRRGRTEGPGTTSDPNQANREPSRDRGAEQVREAPDGSPRRDRPTTPRDPRADPD